MSEIVKLSQHPELKNQLIDYLHSKWFDVKDTYLRSVEDAIRSRMIIPEWYIVLDEEKVAGSAGVLENQIYGKPEFSPNICLFKAEKEEDEDKLIDYIYDDLSGVHIDALYLVEDIAIED